MNSVEEMVRTLSGDKFYKKFVRYVNARQIVKELMILRAKSGLSSKELAKKLGWKKIEKLESSTDKQLNFKQILQYLHGLGYKMKFEEFSNESGDKEMVERCG